MATYSSYNALGSDIQTSEIQDSQVTYAKLGTDLFKAQLLETIDLASQTSVTTGTLTAFNNYLIVLENVNGDATSNLQMRVNGVTSAVYDRDHITNGTTGRTTGGTSWVIFSFDPNGNGSGKLLLGGMSASGGTGNIAVSGHVGITGNEQRILSGRVALGTDTQVSTITLFTSGTAFLTGSKAHVYGVA